MYRLALVGVVLSAVSCTRTSAPRTSPAPQLAGVCGDAAGPVLVIDGVPQPSCANGTKSAESRTAANCSGDGPLFIIDGVPIDPCANGKR
jgi:hypothetical protein